MRDDLHLNSRMYRVSVFLYTSTRMPFNFREKRKMKDTRFLALCICD